MLYIYPYKLGSKSAKALADRLDIWQIKHGPESRFRGRPNRTVINWGASELPGEVNKCRVLNKAESVRVASNKLETFKVLQQARVPTPTWTESQATAIGWIEGGSKVVAREVLTGHSGRGIHILEKGLDFKECLCYTKYFTKSAEYRVHVIGGEVVDVQRKIKDPDRDVKDWNVRSHDNGFIFVRNNDEGKSYKDICEARCKEIAVQAVAALGLDFGGVDICYSKKRNEAVVLEVNTACGLEGQTVEVYASAFRKMLA